MLKYNDKIEYIVFTDSYLVNKQNQKKLKTLRKIPFHGYIYRFRYRF